MTRRPGRIRPPRLAVARLGFARYFGFYNHERPHQALGYRTPAEVYGGAALGLRKRK